jgi:hypothetical protein
VPTPTETLATSKPAAPSAVAANDWRKSWGKAEEHKPLPPPKPAPALVEAPRPDPLKAPERYTRRPVEDKKPAPTTLPAVAAAPAKEPASPVQAAFRREEKPAPVVIQAPPAAVVATPAAPPTPVHQTPVVVSTPAAPPTPVHQTPSVVRTPVVSEALPLGVQSVLAASGGDPSAVQYIPVPVVTIPDVRRAPVPPAGPPPAPWQGSEVVNAFSPAQPGRTSGGPAMANAFGPAAAPVQMGVPDSTQMALAAAYMQHNYAAMQQAMAHGGAYGQGGMMAAPYGGAPANHMQMAASRTMDRRTPSWMQPPQELSPQSVQEMLTVLRDSLYPSQREWAVESLAALDWRMHGDVVQALLSGAREDPAASVRASCIRSLARMNVNTVTVVDAILARKADTDPRVRHEAERALAVLTTGQPAPLGQTVRPAGLR